MVLLGVNLEVLKKKNLVRRGVSQQLHEGDRYASGVVSQGLPKSAQILEVMDGRDRKIL